LCKKSFTSDPQGLNRHGARALQPERGQEEALNLEKSKASLHIALLTGGGDKPYALGLANSLIDQEVELDFIGSDEVNATELDSRGLLHSFNFRGSQDPKSGFVQKAARMLRNYGRLIAYGANAQPKIFHILWNNKFEMFDRTLLMIYYRLMGRKVVFTAHNVNAAERDGNDTFLNRLTLKIQYFLTDYIFVHTQRMRDELHRQFRVRQEKIGIIPFGVNNTVPNTALTSGEARQRLGLSSHHRVLLFFGNIAPYKGLDLLVEVMALLSTENSDYRLVIAGRPKCSEAYWEGLQRRINQLGLRPIITEHSFFIPDDETEVYFKAADVLLLPYRHVFQSGVLFLGYGFGLPAIAADVGSLKDDIVDGETGFVFSPENAEGLHHSIQRFFSSEMFENFENTRFKIREFVEKNHSWTEVGRVTSNVYSSLLEGMASCRSTAT
jgi:D-inositol-3-phosphate glycosyltransferase